MTLPIHFSTLHGGNQPLALFDRQFAAVGNLTVIPCTANTVDGNAIMLTPFDDTPTQHRYHDLRPQFIFAATLDNTNAVTLNVVGAQLQTHLQSDWDAQGADVDPMHGQPPGPGWPRPPIPTPLGARPAFKEGGLVPITAPGDITAGAIYFATFAQALNSGNGGFVVGQSGVAFPNWQSYTPTLTSVTGPYASYTASGGFLVLGHICFLNVSVSIITKGSASGGMFIGLPANPDVEFNSLAMGRNADTGEMGVGIVQPSHLYYALFDNSDPIPPGGGVTIGITGWYPTA